MYPKSHQEIALSSIKCFKDDGTLDLEELRLLMGLALRDDHVDDDEKRVLSNIFKQVSAADVSDAVWQRILSIKEKYEID
jgi:CBS domain containing-hemolysin-like protein